MSKSAVDALVAQVAADPGLQRRFAAAQDPAALAEAVIAAGFDPEDPEIARALGLEAELDEEDLEHASGGIGYATWFSMNPDGVEGW